MTDPKDNKPRPRAGRRRASVGGTTQSGFAGSMSAMISGQSKKTSPEEPKQEKTGKDADDQDQQDDSKQD